MIVVAVQCEAGHKRRTIAMFGNEPGDFTNTWGLVSPRSPSTGRYLALDSSIEFYADDAPAAHPFGGEIVIPGDAEWNAVPPTTRMRVRIRCARCPQRGGVDFKRDYSIVAAALDRLSHAQIVEIDVRAFERYTRQ